MRRAVLLYNPNSGRNPQNRTATIHAIAEAVRSRNLAVDIIPTTAPGTAGQQALADANAGADIVFACGGDGTVHEVIQGLAFHPHVALGIIPLGSGNVLARHLKLPLSPIDAAIKQLSQTPQLIPLGLATYQSPSGEASRYFLLMAGAGPDGALMYASLRSAKQRFGRLAYYLHAARLFCLGRFPPYLAECTLTTGERLSRSVTGVMAVRVSDLGGIFSPLVRGAAIHHPHLHVMLIKSPGQISLPAWFALSWTRLPGLRYFVETCEATELHCNAREGARTHVQIDGEWLGQTPMTATLVPNALRLLMP
jgi:diacylglycerol kinase (ATP)